LHQKRHAPLAHHVSVTTAIILIINKLHPEARSLKPISGLRLL